MAFLWTGGPKPAEYLRYQVTQLYHCTPDEAREVRIEDVVDDLVCLSAERHIRRGTE